MRGAPVSPAEYDAENQPDLEADGYAAGLDVWEQVDKAYGNYLGDGTLANAYGHGEIRAEELTDAEMEAASDALDALDWADYDEDAL